MKILFLGPDCPNLVGWLFRQGEKVVCHNDKITLDFVKENNIDFIISYGYRHIITEDIIDYAKQKAFEMWENRQITLYDETEPNIINLHISLLPYNRGADPNFWSWLDDTPKGVSIHYIDKGLDSGCLIIQKNVVFYRPDETLFSTYCCLQHNIQQLFMQNWEYIKNHVIRIGYPKEKGTYHSKKDIEKYSHLLTHGWDTPVINLKKEKSSD